MSSPIVSIFIGNLPPNTAARSLHKWLQNTFQVQLPAHAVAVGDHKHFGFLNCAASTADAIMSHIASHGAPYQLGGNALRIEVQTGTAPGRKSKDSAQTGKNPAAAAHNMAGVFLKKAAPPDSIMARWASQYITAGDSDGGRFFAFDCEEINLWGLGPDPFSEEELLPLLECFGRGEFARVVFLHLVMPLRCTPHFFFLTHATQQNNKVGDEGAKLIGEGLKVNRRMDLLRLVRHLFRCP
jgi:hypothetical protein